MHGDGGAQAAIDRRVSAEAVQLIDHVLPAQRQARQEQQDTPITGRAAPATLESIEHVLQQRRPLQPQNGQPPHGVMQPQVNPQRPDDQEAGRLRDARAFSTCDPDLDRLAAALFANDEAAISHASAQIGESPQVQQFEQWGRERVAAQEEEGFQRQEMARQTQGPAMRL